MHWSPSQQQLKQCGNLHDQSLNQVRREVSHWHMQVLAVTLLYGLQQSQQSHFCCTAVDIALARR